MEDLRKLKKGYKIFTISLGFVIVLGFICAIMLECLSDASFENMAYVFCSLLLGLIVFIIVVVFLYKRQTKLENRILEYLNKEISSDYKYLGNTPILDLVEDSQFSYEKGMEAHSKDGISGSIEDISFEYYLFSFYRDSFFQNIKKNTYELYIYKNIGIFQEELILSEQNKKEELPQDIYFISVFKNNLYVYKKTERKNPLFKEAKDVEDFQKQFLKELEKIKQTYEETKSLI